VVKSIESIQQKKDTFLYLSFNKPIEWKMASFLTTKIAVGNISYKCVHGIFCNTIDIIYHDLYSHSIVEKSIKVNDQPSFKQFILSIHEKYYEEDKEFYKFFLSVIHEVVHELDIEPTITNIVIYVLGVLVPNKNF
jgi:hypothetical protein